MSRDRRDRYSDRANKKPAVEGKHGTFTCRNFGDVVTGKVSDVHNVTDRRGRIKAVYATVETKFGPRRICIE